jgi:flagellar motor component MotA
VKTLSTIIGAALFIQALVGGFMLAGGKPLALVVPAEIVIVFLAPLGAVVVAYGLDGVWHTLKCLKFLFYTPTQTELAAIGIPVLKALIIATYAVSVAGFLLGCMITAAYLDNPIVEIGHHIAASMTGFIWAIIFCEGLYRPLKHRLEAIVAAKAHLGQQAANADRE